MKIFFALMIFALAFSGYSAVGHAMGENIISKELSSAHHDKADSQNQTKIDNEGSKSKCFDCSHCCSSSAVLVDHVFITVPVSVDVLNEKPLKTFAQSQFFSLLRPPRSLI